MPGKRLTFMTSLLATMLSLPAPAAGGGAGRESEARQTQLVSSQYLEKELQNLNWKQFQSVVKAVPKLRNQVDAYGPLGWQYIQQNYKTYGWRKSIAKLDDAQRRDLQELIVRVRRAE